mmetsp:Transcript_99970/g.157668  ORF Transcript_99970/g.157668 Transcript_99970/m.157668 type:complete len:216 (+) Transcript_99970:71-718(+)
MSQYPNPTVLTGFAAVDCFWVVGWFTSAKLDETPFSSESGVLGCLLGVFASAITIAIAVLAMRTHERNLLSASIFLKLFYFLAVFLEVVQVFFIKKKKMKKNWGYLVLGMGGFFDCIVQCWYLLTVLKGSRKRRLQDPMSESEAEMLRIQRGGVPLAPPQPVNIIINNSNMQSQSQTQDQRQNQYGGPPGPYGCPPPGYGGMAMPPPPPLPMSYR